MASNQHRPKPSLSLRSNTTVRYGSMSSEQPDSDTPSVQTASISQRCSYISVAVLCYINLLNYMDRYTIAGEHTIAIASVMVHRLSLEIVTDVVLILFQVCCLASRNTSSISMTAHQVSYRQVSVLICSTLH